MRPLSGEYFDWIKIVSRSNDLVASKVLQCLRFILVLIRSNRKKGLNDLVASKMIYSNSFS
jgi:hypothetical protein